MNNKEFRPLLTTRDWNEEWISLQDARQFADDPAIWDQRAKTFSVKHGSQNGYVGQFLKLAGVRADETVLDMGCGTGALATPLAQAGNHVIACDFSQGMLDVMKRDQEALGVSSVDVRVMSWEEDWDCRGITENSVDVALASRSIATHDLKQSLMKLNRVAKRRVCLTLPASISPKCDEKLLAAAGFDPQVGRDFLYAFVILANSGLNPEVAYIPNTRMEIFDSREDALACFSEIVRSAMKGLVSHEDLAAVPERLSTWLDDELVEDELGFHLAKEREVTWAFIAWNK